MRSAALQVLERVAAGLGGASVASVMANKRNKWACRIRHTAMLALRRREWSYPKIGQAFGGMDHTTVINGCKKAAVLEVTDDAVLAVLTAEAKLAAEEQLAERLKRLGSTGAEHQRLADAVCDLLDAIDDERSVADLPTQVRKLAAAWRGCDMFTNPRAAMVEALQGGGG